MVLWLSVIDKKVAHPHEIQNTLVPSKVPVIFNTGNIYHDFKNFGKTRLYNVAKTVSCC